MDRESPELIEREMEQTRESLTHKVSLLENKVIGQVETATDTVQGTIDTVKDSVQSLTDGMKEALDVRKHTQEHPLAMLGGAAAAGFITGLLVFRKESSASGGDLGAYTPLPAAAMAAPAVSHRPQWLN